MEPQRGFLVDLFGQPQYDDDESNPIDINNWLVQEVPPLQDENGITYDRLAYDNVPDNLPATPPQDLDISQPPEGNQKGKQKGKQIGKDKGKEKIRCTARCKSCAGCVCAQAHQFCWEQCKCRLKHNECKNTPDKVKLQKGNSIASWSSGSLVMNPPPQPPELPKDQPFFNTASALECVEKFLPDELIDNYIVRGTNEYAEKRGAQIKPFTLEKIKDFFICVTIMGMNPCPQLKQYWQGPTTECGVFGNTPIKKLCSRNTYSTLSKYLHMSDDNPNDKVDSSFVGEFIKIFMENSKKYNPDNVRVKGVDEIMLKFKGKFAGRQCVKGKPNPTGLKMFAMASKGGFLVDVISRSKRQEILNLESAKPLDVVLNFAKQLDKGDVVVVDAFFGSKFLAEELSKIGIDYILMCRKNHPSYLFSDNLCKNLKKGDSRCLLNPEGTMFATGFSDKREIGFMSSKWGKAPLDKKKKKDGTEQYRPNVCKLYNEYMDGVDVFDSALNRYLYSHRHPKWTDCVLYDFWKMMIVNSWIVYKEYQNPKCTQLEFLLLYIQGYFEKHHPSFLQQESKEGHFLILKEKFKNPKRCTAGTASCKKNSNTSFLCSVCKKHFHPICFFETHIAKLK